MKISFNWLKSYLDFNESPEAVSAILTDTGLEVEKLESFDTLPGGLKGVVVGHVVEIDKHPDADKLKVTKVDIGNGIILPIVCGAPNVDKGQKVLVATVGTTLYPSPEESFKIKKAKIRGEVSEGMICAEDELGIGKSHDGIMVLPNDTPVGIDAATYLDMESDFIFEIGLTPNRTDGFGHFGVARDLAARLSLKEKTRAKLPELSELPKPITPDSGLSIRIDDKEACGRYAGQVIANIKVTPSPKWLQDRLLSVGLSPINNIVDITNFVQHETGQPLHAFDIAKITGNEIRVNTLPSGTKFKTLDEVERELNSADLMISNAEGGMCIAGVFGGIDSGVSDQTQSVFIESAWFNPVRVRKTAKRHGLNTDASFRFERGVDPQGTIYALKRAISLILEIAGGELKGEIFDEISEVPAPVELNFRLSRYNQISGADLPKEVLLPILDSLDIEVLDENGDNYALRIPTYRADVTREIDVIEEVLRIYGFNTVALPERMQLSVSIDPKPSRQELIDNISQTLVGRGFYEMMSNGLTQSSKIAAVASEEETNKLVAMLNPLSMELDVLRPNLIVSALESISYNLNRQSERLRFFEIGKSYERTESGFSERTLLSIAMTGNRHAENWNNDKEQVDTTDLAGNVKAIFDAMGIDFKLASFEGDAFVDEGLSFLVRNKPVGRGGMVSAKALKSYGIKKDVWIAEIDMDTCMPVVKHAAISLDTLPKFPSVRRDLSLLVNSDVTFAEIERIGYSKGGKLMKEIGLFDVYEGKNLPEGKKSYAVSFLMQDVSKTLGDKQIDKTMLQIQETLESKLGASLR